MYTILEQKNSSQHYQHFFWNNTTFLTLWNLKHIKINILIIFIFIYSKKNKKNRFLYVKQFYSAL